jgi:hypothetical protein
VNARSLCRLVVATFVLGATVAIAADVTQAEAFIARAFIPSSNNVHGEVRLIQRGDTACVQTLLYSKFLRRGLYEMEKAERSCWADGYGGWEDSTNYIAAMRATRDAILGDGSTPTAEPTSPSDEKKKMLIEFTLSPTDAGYTLSKLNLDGSPEALRIVDAPRVMANKTTAYYASRAMQVMAAKAFGLSDDEAASMLKKIGWRSVEPPPLTPAQQPVPRG